MGKGNKLKIALIVVFSVFIALIVALLIVFSALNAGDFSHESAMNYLKGATRLSEGYETEDVRFTVSLRKGTDSDVYLDYSVEYKNTPKERMYDVLAVEYMRHMYVARNDDFELEFNATLSYMQSGTQKTAEYGGVRRSRYRPSLCYDGRKFFRLSLSLARR